MNQDRNQDRNQDTIPSRVCFVSNPGKVSKWVFVRVKASSLVEVTVASLLVVLVSSAALLLFLQVCRSAPSYSQFRRQLWLKNHALHMRQTASYQNQTVSMADGILDTKISYYQNDPHLLVIELTFTPYPTENTTEKTVSEENRKRNSYKEIISVP